MIKLMSLIKEWSSKRDPNKADLKWIRHIQISTADPDVIRHDHIKKTHKAMKKVDKKLAQQFEKLGDNVLNMKANSGIESEKIIDVLISKP